TLETPTISVGAEVTSGKVVNATCEVSYSCPSDPLHITWNHNGTRSNEKSNILTFTPSREDHNKNLSCSVSFKGKTVTGYTMLKVK
ncbi:hypothetical protein M9458_030880, partial [Cirrhinus mrigala]